MPGTGAPAALFDRLFDDASMFPPGSLPPAEAVRSHREHRRSWYEAMVGVFVCGVPTLRTVALAVEPGEPMDLALVVGAGSAGLVDALREVAELPGLRLTAVELPLGDADPAGVRAAVPAEVPVYAEVPVPAVDAAVAGRLAEAGCRLKLRTGGTAAGAFPTEQALARAVEAAVCAGVPFKCTAGLHNAVRHTDPATGFEHHGFLNMLLAVQACARGNDALPWLAERDGGRLAAAAREVSVEVARAAFLSFGTCSIAEPVGDLITLDLVTAPSAAAAR